MRYRRQVGLNSQASQLATATFALDIGMDGAIEHTYTASGTSEVVTFPLTFGSQDFVLIRAEYFASGSVSAHTTTTSSIQLRANMWIVEDVLPSVQVLTYGPYCGPYLRPTTSTTQSGHQFILNVATAPRSSAGAWVVGIQPAAVSIGACDLLVVPLVVLPTRSSSVGTVSFQFRTGTCELFDVYLQALFYDYQASQVVGTKGVRVNVTPPP